MHFVFDLIHSTSVTKPCPRHMPVHARKRGRKQNNAPTCSSSFNFERKDYANKITPVCVNQGKSLHLVQAPGKPPPSNEEEGH